MTSEESEQARYELQQSGAAHLTVIILIAIYCVIELIVTMLFYTVFSRHTSLYLGLPISIIIFCKLMMNNRGSIKIGWNNVAFLSDPYLNTYRTVTRRFNFKLPWEDVKVIDLSYKHQIKNDPKKSFRTKDDRWVSIEAILILTPDWRNLSQYVNFKDDTIDEMGTALLDQFLNAYCAEHDSTQIMPSLTDLESKTKSKLEIQQAFEQMQLAEFTDKYGVVINDFQIKTVEPSEQDKENDADIAQATTLNKTAEAIKKKWDEKDSNNPLPWSEAIRQAKEIDSIPKIIHIQGLESGGSFYWHGGDDEDNKKNPKNKKTKGKASK